MVIPIMKFSDSSRRKNFAKDPAVIKWKSNYYLYYSISPYKSIFRKKKGWAIGIAKSVDLENWTKIGEILPEQEYEQKGICAPGVIVYGDKIHLFYQTYGNGPRDAICHAWSEDAIHFHRNLTNPIFRPSGNWNNGRAIDADIIFFRGIFYLYWATRDPSNKIQMLGVTTAKEPTDFSKDEWTQQGENAILKPELPWEQRCIEAPAICIHNENFYMFYGGAYNNSPQQIGVAKSTDGITWNRILTNPILPNGQPGEWNSSESGHPFVFQDEKGQDYLFFQGNNDNGQTWFLSKKKIRWDNGFPILSS